MKDEYELLEDIDLLREQLLNKHRAWMAATTLLEAAQREHAKLKDDHEALQERLEEVGAELIRERRKTEQTARARWYQGDRLDSASRHAKEMGED